MRKALLVLVGVLVLTTAVGAFAQQKDATGCKDNPLFNRTNAATNDNVHFLDGQNWYLVGGGIGVLESMIDEIDSAVS